MKVKTTAIHAGQGGMIDPNGQERRVRRSTHLSPRFNHGRYAMKVKTTAIRAGEGSMINPNGQRLRPAHHHGLNHWRRT